MGFQAVSLGYTKKHGRWLDFKDLLFKEIIIKDGKITFFFHPDIMVNNEFKVELEFEVEVEIGNIDTLDEIDEIDEQMDDMAYSLLYEGDSYTIGMGHCCSYGLIAAVVGDCGKDTYFTPAYITKFTSMLQSMYDAKRIKHEHLLNMTSNCCS